MRRRKEMALEEQQSFCFKDPCSFLLRCMQGIRYLRTDKLLIHWACVCVCMRQRDFSTSCTHLNTNCNMTSSQKRPIRVLKRASDTVPS